MKRILASLLAALMLISLLPVVSLAAGETYTKISSMEELTTGTYVITFVAKNVSYAVTQYDSSGWILSTAMDTSSDKITDAKGATWTITVNGTSVKLTDANGVTVKPKAGNNNGIQTGDYSWAVTCTDGTFRFAGVGSDTTVLAVNAGSQNKLRAYKSSTVNGNATGYPSYFTLYKQGVAGEEVPDCGDNHTPETVAGTAATCTKTGLTEGSKCSVCGTVLTAQETIEMIPHNYVDGYCSVCGRIEEPEADTELTIAQALQLGAAMGHDNYTEGKYYVTGEITEVYNTQYGNLYITDGENTLTVYGTYSADGSARYDAMDVKPIAGDTVTVYGVIGAYGSSNPVPQMKNGWIVEHEQTGCPHETTYELDDAKAPTCTETGLSATVMCSVCGEVVKEQETVPANGHDRDEAGYCTVCGDYEEPKAEATLDFSTDTQRVSRDSNSQVWQEGTLVFTNNKAASTTDVGNYTNPVRLYKNSDIIIEFPNMTSVVFNGVSGEYAFNVEAAGSISGGTVTVDGTTVTITFDEPVDSLTITKLGNQTRFTSLTAYAKTASEEPEHVCTPGAAVKEDVVAATCETAGSYNSVIYCTDPECGKVISSTPMVIDALGHTEETVAGYAATCTTTGLTDGTKCSVCGETLTEQTETPKAKHAWDEGVYTDPTLEADGFTTYTCGTCGATDVKTDEGSQLSNLEITGQPAAATAAAGTSATFTVAATGKGLTYQWQWAYADRNTWMNTALGGFDTATLTVPAYQARDGYRYRCYITDAQGNVVITKTATLEVTAPEGLVQPVDATAAVGATATFTVGTEVDAISYQWQWAYANGTNWMNTGLTGNKTNTLSVPVLAGRNGYQYRCRVVMADGSAYVTDAATLTVG